MIAIKESKRVCVRERATPVMDVSIVTSFGIFLTQLRDCGCWVIFWWVNP
jgi:hypothetical protein